MDDPGAYTKPWSGKWTINEKTGSSWIAGGEMFEYICEDADRQSARQPSDNLEKLQLHAGVVLGSW